MITKIDHEKSSPKGIVYKKCSAGELAKKVIFHNITSVEFWDEQFPDEWKKLTDREKDLVNGQIEKIMGRIIKNHLLERKQ